MAEWRAKHDGSITIVISTAYGLEQAINGGNETRIKASCDALKNNYQTFLRPIPSPSGPLGENFGKWDQALDEIYNAQKYCSSGLLGLRKSDLYQARMAASTGVALLHEVVGTNDSG